MLEAGSPSKAAKLGWVGWGGQGLGRLLGCEEVTMDEVSAYTLVV